MFSFAGILEETEVILQTQRELMMEDDVTSFFGGEKR